MLALVLIAVAATPLQADAPRAAAAVVDEGALDVAALDAAADDVARWLAAAALPTEAGVTWPVEPGGPAAPPTLYSGSPGVVLFLLEHHTRRGDEASLTLALAGARELAHHVARTEAPQFGLYTGLAGIGFTLTLAAVHDDALRDAALRCLDRVLAGATETAAGARWNGSTDVISGSAGIGLWLLDAAARLDRGDALEAAVRAGDDLLARARPAAGGLGWRMDDGYPREMPGLSHGAAGVGLLLTRLAEELAGRDDPRAARFLAGAVAAGAHLRGLAAPQPGGGRLVHHSAPGGEELFYLGWCHGPPGTARFLHALERVTGDPAWRTLADELVLGLTAAGLPAARPDGYWDNVGLCCGASGIAAFLVRRAAAHGDGPPELALALTRDVLARGTPAAGGLSWTHCEHRVRPDLRSTQTGLMQGAAGVGLWLLELAAELERAPRHLALPDDPLARR